MSANDDIADRLRSHAIDLLRYDAELRRKARKLLDSLEADLINAIRQIDPTGPTRIRYQRERLIKLLDFVRSTIATGYREIDREMVVELRELAAIEASFAAAAVNKVVKVELIDAVLTAEQLRSIVSDVLIQGAPSKEWWKRQSEGLTRRFSDEIRQGMAAGESIEQMVNRVRGGVDETGVSRPGFFDTSKRHAEALVRSSVLAVSNDARLAMYRGQEDILKGVQQISTLDNRVSDICLAYSAKAWKLDGTPIDHNLPFNGGPPRHWNSVAAGTMITTAIGQVPIERIKKGDLVVTHRGRLKPVAMTMHKPCEGHRIRRIRLESGLELFTSDEHPILTRSNGWVRADTIRCGDELFQNSAEKAPVGAFAVVVEAADNYPPCFSESEIFTSIGDGPAVVTSAVEFDYNLVGWKGKIADVAVEDELTLIPNAIGIKDSGKLKFHLRRGIKLAFSRLIGRTRSRLRELHRIVSQHTLRVIGIMRMGFLRQSVSPMIFAAEFSSYMSGAHGYRRSIPLSAHGNIVAFAPTLENSLADTQLSLNSSEGLASKNVLLLNKVNNGCAVSKVNHWNLVRVAEISTVYYAGEVFNLAVEEDETYIASGIIVHNCRSTLTPILRSFKEISGLDIPEPPKSTRSSMDGQVAEDLDMADWIRKKEKQEAGFADKLLGPGRADLFLSGKITLTDLVDQRGRPLTLEQLKQRMMN